jgi:RNA polymerase sigma-70 factor (ECF subfamily)
MASPSNDDRLSQISTKWDLIRSAHSGQPKEATPAQMRLLLRYFGAINRYLLGALREVGAAEELGQEFAFRFIRGDFQGADPERGRFRDYLKTVLFRMVAHYRKQQMAQPRPLPATFPAPPVGPAEPVDASDDAKFRRAWRRQLLDRAWQELAKVQRKTGQPFYAVLELRVEHAHGEFSSAQMAEHLAGRFRRRFTADGVRKLLQRAREKFAEFLLEEVVASLEEPSPEQLEQELRELGLWVYCRPALLRRNQAPCRAESTVDSNAC